MSNIFGRLFNSNKTDTGYQGPKPYGSLLDATGGQDYYNTVKSRLAGNGVGYSDGYVNKATNPVIAKMRNQFQSYDLPELKSELTATGRRAGSGGFQQISKAYENQNLNEEAAYAPIYAANEEARRSDTNNSLDKLGAFNSGDYNARNILSNFEYTDHNRQVEEANARRNNEAKGLQSVGQAGVQLLFGQNSPNPFSGSAPVSYGGKTYATSQPPIDQQDYYRQLLSRSVASQGQKGRV